MERSRVTLFCEIFLLSVVATALSVKVLGRGRGSRDARGQPQIMLLLGSLHFPDEIWGPPDVISSLTPIELGWVCCLTVMQPINSSTAESKAATHTGNGFLPHSLSSIYPESSCSLYFDSSYTPIQKFFFFCGIWKVRLGQGAAAWASILTIVTTISSLLLLSF